MTRWATFDCYGTLIDWNGGIRAELARLWPDEDADALLHRYHELEQFMADPTVTADHLRLQEIGRERAELDGVVTAFRQLRDTEAAIAETETLAADPEMADLAAEELRTLRDRHQT